MTFLFSQVTHIYITNRKSPVLGSAKTENILHQLLLSRGGNGESFKWKLLYPRYSVFFSVNCLGLSANEVVPKPWGLPHNNYLSGPAKLGKISGSVTCNCFPALLRYAHMLYANLSVKFKQKK